MIVDQSTKSTMFFVMVAGFLFTAMCNTLVAHAAVGLLLL